MNNQYPQPNNPPEYGLIRFLAAVGLITIFVLGVALGLYLASRGI